MMSRERNIQHLRIARVGILQRKDDVGQAGKRANSRKWKSWGVMLSDSHLMFFVSDPTITTASKN